MKESKQSISEALRQAIESGEQFQIRQKGLMAWTDLSPEYELRVKPPKATYRMGDLFTDNSYHNDSALYMLVQVSPLCVALIHLPSGNRYSDAVPVSNVSCITEEEFIKITDGETFIKLNAKLSVWEVD